LANELKTEEIQRIKIILYVVGSGYEKMPRINNIIITKIKSNNFTFTALQVRILISFRFFAVSFDNFSSYPYSIINTNKFAKTIE
jgi:hypothetical protein